ncbi:SRPBCC family protein [Novosphingobium sp. RD2P27]|uniref:SRPBCC family protein n=1 Tax=Novosphingobium kalidii TaxID=3230299 RepID=A0ABV2CY00_9SPHN
MIDTEQTISIAAPIERVWQYARDIPGWAKLMPGLQDCDVIDEDRSRWTLKVGAGALVRTVRVAVTVDRWAGPDEVDFTYVLEGDPVKGGGTYRAGRVGASQTEVALAVRVEGTGPMAPMWEAMGRPLLPKFAHSFAEQFKAEIEQAGEVSATVSREPEVTTGKPVAGRKGVIGRLRAFFRKLFGRSAGTAR